MRSLRRRNAVNNFFINRNANAGRKTSITFERRLRFTLQRHILGNPIDFGGGHSFLDQRSQFEKDLGDDAAGTLHPFDFTGLLRLIIPCILASAGYNSHRGDIFDGGHETEWKESSNGYPSYAVSRRGIFRTEEILEGDGVIVRVASTTAQHAMESRAAWSWRTCRSPMKGGRIRWTRHMRWNVRSGVLVERQKTPGVATAMSSGGKVVAAICLSTVVLAKAKLLTGREATVYSCPRRSRN